MKKICRFGESKKNFIMNYKGGDWRVGQRNRTINRADLSRRVSF